MEKFNNLPILLLITVHLFNYNTLNNNEKVCLLF